MIQTDPCMKKLVLTLVFFSVTTTVFSQTNKKKRINKKRYEKKR